MQNGWFSSKKTPQSLYFLDNHATMPGWFKGMELIIKEQGLYPEGGLKSQCEGFKCVVGRKDCCCRRVLFNQPDFCVQKSHLEEYITSRGHICDFYPKYHCELNFIEQYWGAAKYIYRSSAKTADLNAMERNDISCLDDVPLLQIQRWARILQFFCIFKLNYLLDLLIDWCDSFMLIRKVSREVRLLGPTGDIMDTEHSHLRCSNSSRRSIGTEYT